MKNFILKVLLLISYIILIIINRFKNIKIGRIYTSRVGHIAFNLDNYSHFILKQKKKPITFFGIDPFIANKSLLKLFVKNNYYFFSRFFYYLYEYIKKIYPKSKLLINYYPELHDSKSLMSKSLSPFVFNETDNEKNLMRFESLNLPKEYIIIHNRDKNYRLYQDKNFHDYRNFNFSDYHKAIKFFKNELNFIRLGQSSKLQKKLSLNNIFFIEKENYSELFELFLIKNSKFVVSGNSGFLNIATCFRIPTLMINTIPFNLDDFIARSSGSIIAPKKIYDIKKEKYLNLKEIIDLKVNMHNEKDFFEKNFTYINNTEDEIIDTIKEMNLKINDKKEFDKKYSKVSKEIDNYLFNNEQFNFLRTKLSINISYEFILKNNFLLK